MKVLLRKALTVSLFSVTAVAAAQEIDRAAIEERIDEIVERLELSDEQIEQISPILQDSMERQRAILESYGVDPANRGEGGQRPGMRKARAMRKEMSEVREDSRGAMAEFLSDEQMDELQLIQEERRDALREKIRGR